jgi:alkanesulfonate monooxygenase SsuD/methylene tetrahydromethanopterin reductase-like flavin-dependent oxidoreductase (luciferase family)
MARPVTFGLINTFGNPDTWQQPTARRYAQIFEQIEWIDRDLPIDGVYVTEHHFYDDGYLPSPMTMTAAIAARTSRVTVGTNLIQLPLHHPVRLAEDALVVDAISNGRLRLGLGLGYYHQEFGGLGVRLSERASRAEEAVQILRHAFSGQRFSYDGNTYQLPEIDVTPRPIRPNGPEIWMGGFAPKAIERAARLADGFLAFDLNNAQQYLDACKRIGKPREEQRLNCTYWAIIADDPEKAFALAGPHWLHLLNQYIVRDAYVGRQPPLTEPYDNPADALADGLVMLADATSALAEFNRVIALGAIDINLVTLMPGEPIAQVSDRLQYLADKVIPFLSPSTHPALADPPGVTGPIANQPE